MVTNNLHKEFFCKVAWEIHRSRQDFWPGNVYFFTIISIVYKVFSIIFSILLFYLICKMFSRMCFFTRKSGEKECFLQSNCRGFTNRKRDSFLPKSVSRYYRLLDFFNRDSSLFPVSINSSVTSSIMGKLWEAIDPYLAQTVIFSFHRTLKEKKLTNNRKKKVPL